MEYKGFTYDTDVDEQDDVRKIWHNIRLPDGTLAKEPSWFGGISPYRHATREEFEQAVNEIFFEYWVAKKVDSLGN